MLSSSFRPTSVILYRILLSALLIASAVFYPVNQSTAQVREPEDCPCPESVGVGMDAGMAAGMSASAPAGFFSNFSPTDTVLPMNLSMTMYSNELHIEVSSPVTFGEGSSGAGKLSIVVDIAAGLATDPEDWSEFVREGSPRADTPVVKHGLYQAIFDETNRLNESLARSNLENAVVTSISRFLGNTCAENPSLPFCEVGPVAFGGSFPNDEITLEGNKSCETYPMSRPPAVCRVGGPIVQIIFGWWTYQDWKDSCEDTNSTGDGTTEVVVCSVSLGLLESDCDGSGGCRVWCRWNDRPEKCLCKVTIHRKLDGSGSCSYETVDHDACEADMCCECDGNSCPDEMDGTEWNMSPEIYKFEKACKLCVEPTPTPEPTIPPCPSGMYCVKNDVVKCCSTGQKCDKSGDEPNCIDCPPGQTGCWETCCDPGIACDTDNRRCMNPTPVPTDPCAFPEGFSVCPPGLSEYFPGSYECCEDGTEECKRHSHPGGPAFDSYSCEDIARPPSS